MQKSNHSHWRAAELVVRQLQAHGYEGYIVGGAVRDILLGQTPKDFDIVTNATPEQIMAIDAFMQAKHKDTAQAYGITRVRIPLDDGTKEEIEVATYRRDVEAHQGRKLTKIEFSHIEDDLQRRDFTVNALALDPYSHVLIDLSGGLADLEAKCIRFIGEPLLRIKEDPLRILRAVRFRNQLGFDYDKQTRQALERAIDNDYLEQIAIDRVRIELTRILINPNRHHAFADMDELGILQRLLPELTACKGVAQPKNYHAEGDVWVHTLRCIEALPKHPSQRLAWATLLHDIGKPPTITLPSTPTDRIHFNHHHAVGSRLANAILTRLNFPKKMIADITWMVHYHLITDDFPHMRPSRRQHYMSHPAFHDLLELHKADIHGSLRADPSADDGSQVIAELEAAWQGYLLQSQQKPPTIKDALGVDGHWLQSQLGVISGPLLGQILQQLQDDFLDDEVTTEAQARKRAHELKQKLSGVT